MSYSYDAFARTYDVQYGAAIEADMRDFDATEHGPFEFVYCPARGFLHLLAPEDQLKALKNVRRHLREGARFAGNIFFPSVALLHKGETRPAA